MERGIFRGQLDDERRAIFIQILNRKTGREASAELGITPKRLESIVRNTCRQLDARSRYEAAFIMANHYGRKVGQSGGVGNDKSTVGSSRFGTGIFYNPAKTAQTEHEHLSSSVYVRDVGNRVFEENKISDAFNEITGRFSVLRILAASSIVQRVSLLALLIASSALALSALVSAMQGFDVLVYS